MACWKTIGNAQRATWLSFYLGGSVSAVWPKLVRNTQCALLHRQLSSLCSTQVPHVSSTLTHRKLNRSSTFQCNQSPMQNCYFSHKKGSAIWNIHPCQFNTNCRGGMLQEQKDSKKDEKTAVASSQGIFERFKDAYKEYGKVLVSVHVATSIVWYGTFVYAAASGVDVVPLLEKMGAGETLIKPFKSGAGHFAVAYLLYKLATPARYTVTIGGTQLTVRKLREWGYMEPVSKEDSLRNLMKEGKSQMKTKYSEKKEDFKDKVDDFREEIKSRRKGKDL